LLREEEEIKNSIGVLKHQTIPIWIDESTREVTL
jgi:hypothetical protein